MNEHWSIDSITECGVESVFDINSKKKTYTIRSNRRLNEWTCNWVEKYGAYILLSENCWSKNRAKLYVVCSNSIRRG